MIPTERPNPSSVSKVIMIRPESTNGISSAILLYRDGSTVIAKQSRNEDEIERAAGELAERHDCLISYV